MKNMSCASLYFFANDSIVCAWLRTSWTARGRLLSWFTTDLRAWAVSVLLFTPSSIASMYSAISWVTNVFVAATPISGPARVYITWSTSRVMAEPMTLTIATVLLPRFLASRAAAIVSRVSPLWVTRTTNGFSLAALEYLYSDDIWTVVGMPDSSSMMYLPTSPA